MKSFVIFAIVVTIIYVIYYTVIIVQDLYGKPKDEKSQGESFDVSDMTDEEESIAVSESDGGFSVGDNQYETAYEEKQLAEPPLRKRASLMCLKRYKAQSRRRWRK
jgi:hypothetical protein